MRKLKVIARWGCIQDLYNRLTRSIAYAKRGWSSYDNDYIHLLEDMEFKLARMYREAQETVDLEHDHMDKRYRATLFWASRALNDREYYNGYSINTKKESVDKFLVTLQNNIYHF